MAENTPSEILRSDEDLHSDSDFVDSEVEWPDFCFVWPDLVEFEQNLEILWPDLGEFERNLTELEQILTEFEQNLVTIS